MKLTRRTMPEFEEALREVLGRFDFELQYDGNNFVNKTPFQETYYFTIVPFADHKPFYKGQK